MPSGDEGASGKPSASEEELRRRLTEEQYMVTQEGATEPPFTGAYLNEKRAGSFRCVVCDAELFSSDAKFESGTGWPSFTEPANRANVETKLDTSLGMRRTEVLCGSCGAHLGHLFEDGPAPTGQRYCMNSAALEFQTAAASGGRADSGRGAEPM